MTLDDAIKNAKDLFSGAAYRALMLIKAGYGLKR